MASNNADLSTVKVPRLLRVREVSRLIRIAPWRLYQLHSQGLGPPAFRLGKTLNFPEHLLVAWINEQAAKRPAPEPGAVPAPPRRKGARR